MLYVLSLEYNERDHCSSVGCYSLDNRYPFAMFRPRDVGFLRRNRTEDYLVCADTEDSTCLVRIPDISRSDAFAGKKQV